MTVYWLALRKMTVENANAIAGLTWGFPAISHFVGFSHLLSRQLDSCFGVRLNGCAVIVHQHQVHAYKRNGWHIFAQTRNPLTKEGETAPIVQEGRMHFVASVLMPFSCNSPDLDTAQIEQTVRQLCFTGRLAGGTITKFDYQLLNEPADLDRNDAFHRKTLLRFLPGFALVERSQYLAKHHIERLKQNNEAELVDTLLDFVALKNVAEIENDKINWRRSPKPERGWLVPINIGYQAISELYRAGTVAGARSMNEPFRFVESVYTIGEWISPHRVKSLNDLVWRYKAEPETGRYLCCNDCVTYGNHMESAQ